MIDPAVPLLFCTRRKDVPAGAVVPPGVGTAYCAGCGAKVLVSTASARMVAARTAQPVCGPCLPKTGVLVPVMTAEQAAELVSFNDSHRRN